MQNITKLLFEVGKTYSTCGKKYTVIKRSDSFISFRDDNGNILRRKTASYACIDSLKRIYGEIVYIGNNQYRPHCTQLRADQFAQEETLQEVNAHTSFYNDCAYDIDEPYSDFAGDNSQPEQDIPANHTPDTAPAYVMDNNDYWLWFPNGMENMTEAEWIEFSRDELEIINRYCNAKYKAGEKCGYPSYAITILPSEKIKHHEYASYPNTITDDYPYTVIPALDCNTPSEPLKDNSLGFTIIPADEAIILREAEHSPAMDISPEDRIAEPYFPPEPSTTIWAAGATFSAEYKIGRKSHSLNFTVRPERNTWQEFSLERINTGNFLLMLYNPDSNSTRPMAAYSPILDCFQISRMYEDTLSQFSAQEAIRKQIIPLLPDFLRDSDLLDEDGQFAYDDHEAFRCLYMKSVYLERSISRHDFSMPDNPFTTDNDRDNPLSWPDSPFRPKALRVFLKIINRKIDARNHYNRSKSQANAINKSIQSLSDELHKLFEAQKAYIQPIEKSQEISAPEYLDSPCDFDEQYSDYGGDNSQPELDIPAEHEQPHKVFVPEIVHDSHALVTVASLLDAFKIWLAKLLYTVSFILHHCPDIRQSILLAYEQKRHEPWKHHHCNAAGCDGRAHCTHDQFIRAILIARAVKDFNRKNLFSRRISEWLRDSHSLQQLKELADFFGLRVKFPPRLNLGNDAWRDKCVLAAAIANFIADILHVYVCTYEINNPPALPVELQTTTHASTQDDCLSIKLPIQHKKPRKRIPFEVGKTYSASRDSSYCGLQSRHFTVLQRSKKTYDSGHVGTVLRVKIWGDDYPERFGEISIYDNKDSDAFIVEEFDPGVFPHFIFRADNPNATSTVSSQQQEHSQHNQQTSLPHSTKHTPAKIDDTHDHSFIECKDLHGIEALDAMRHNRLLAKSFFFPEPLTAALLTLSKQTLISLAGDFGCGYLVKKKKKPELVASFVKELFRRKEHEQKKSAPITQPQMPAPVRISTKHELRIDSKRQLYFVFDEEDNIQEKKIA